MSSTAYRTTFAYEALPDARAYIRLLRSLKTEDEDNLEYELKTFFRDSSPPYVALSYHWGDSNVKSTVSVNNAGFEIVGNCKYTLLQAQWNAPGHWYWVDALCINQADNYEKSHQVQMMGSIFGSAMHVLACVGPHSPSGNSKPLLDFVRKNQVHLSDVSDRIRSDNDSGPAWQVKQGRKIKDAWWLIRISSSKMTKLIAALLEFLERPYFFRLWVAQELSRANSTSICCGSDQASIKSLEGLLEICSWGTPWPGIIGYQNIWFLRRLSRHRGEDLEHLVYLPNYHFLIKCGGSGNNILRSYGDIVGKLSKLRCTETRDIVYGALGLLYTSQADQITVDYEKPRLRLALEVLQILHIQGDSGLNRAINSLVDALQLRATNESVSHAICLRRLSLTQSPLLTTNSAPNYQRVRYTCPAWQVVGKGKDCSIFISKHHPRHPRHGSKRYLPPDELSSSPRFLKDIESDPRRDDWPEPVPDSVELRTKDNKIVAALCRNTQPGDWLVPLSNTTENWPFRFPFQSGLVLRADTGGQFMIVGQALLDYVSLESQAVFEHFFEIAFALEDLVILLAQERSMYEKFGNDDAFFRITSRDIILTRTASAEIAARLAKGVCRNKGSSYGRKSQRPTDLPDLKSWYEFNVEQLHCCRLAVIDNCIKANHDI
ncbi:MAG: hypothetical protein Q9227_008224 [Pyrenula ochraceoflavens]